MVAADLTGLWAGTIIQGSSSTPIFASLTVEDDDVNVSYVVPVPTGDYGMGNFKAAMQGESLMVRFAVDEPSDSRRFHLRVVQNESGTMIAGHFAFASGTPGLASVTLYKVKPIYSGLKGIWPTIR